MDDVEEEATNGGQESRRMNQDEKTEDMNQTGLCCAPGAGVSSQQWQDEKTEDDCK